MLRQRIVSLGRAPLLEWRRRSYYTGPVVPLDQIKEEMGGYGGGSVELTREILADPAQGPNIYKDAKPLIRLF
jgi:hypothetical protein